MFFMQCMLQRLYFMWPFPLFLKHLTKTSQLVQTCKIQLAPFSLRLINYQTTEWPSKYIVPFTFQNILLKTGRSHAYWHSINLSFVSSLHTKAKDEKDKAKLNLKGLKPQKKRRPQETTGTVMDKTVWHLTLEFNYFLGWSAKWNIEYRLLK